MHATHAYARLPAAMSYLGPGRPPFPTPNRDSSAVCSTLPTSGGTEQELKLSPGQAWYVCRSQPVGTVYVSNPLCPGQHVGTVYVSNPICAGQRVGTVYVSNPLCPGQHVGTVYVSNPLCPGQRVGTVYVSNPSVQASV